MNCEEEVISIKEYFNNNYDIEEIIKNDKIRNILDDNHIFGFTIDCREEIKSLEMYLKKSNKRKS